MKTLQLLAFDHIVFLPMEIFLDNKHILELSLQTIATIGVRGENHMRARSILSMSLAILLCGVLFGQAFTGSISGIVTDPGGALVSDVVIVVTDIDKNTRHRTTTNQTGYYAISSLPPGNYLVHAEKAGFRQFSLSGLPLTTQEQASVNVQLQIGALAESVTVTGQAQMLETNTSSLSAVVENKRIVDLPLNGRNILQLASLVPGVFTGRPSSGTDTATGQRYFVNGGQEATGDILLDGVTTVVGGSVNGIAMLSASPSVESVQEFRIQTNSFAAEYGHSGAGMITIVTKSGTNHIHGSAYEFLRNSAMDSNNFFANRSGIPLTSFKRNQFGGSLSGPVVLPKLYDGHNKTFFFADYEGLRLRSANFVQQTVPTELEKQGDFSQWFNTNGTLRQIYDPFSTRPDPNLAANSGINVRDPVPGNKIPAAKMNPVSLAVQKYYPAPNLPGAPFTHINNFLVQSANSVRQERVEFKIDHAFNERQRFFIRYSLLDGVSNPPNFWGNLANPTAAPSKTRGQNAGFDYTHTIGAATVLNVRYGLARAVLHTDPWARGFAPSTLGLPKAIDSVTNFLIFPDFRIDQYTDVGQGSSSYSASNNYTHHMIGNVSRVSGRHSWKAGVDFRVLFVNDTSLLYPTGLYMFNSVFTQGPRPDVVTATGGAYPSFLYGTMSQAQLGHEPDLATSSRYYAAFFQDDFKVSKRLTLNLGLRWDIEGGATERYDRIAAIDLDIKSPIADRVGLPLRGGYLFAGDNKSLGRRAIRPTDYKLINPRAGLAYQVNSTTVFRMGYGIFYGQNDFGAGKRFTGSAFRSTTRAQPVFPNGLPQEVVSNPFVTDGFSLPTGSAAGLLAQLGLGPLDGGYAPGLKSNNNQNWNVAIQHSFGKDKDMLLEVAYAGNKGTHTAISYVMSQLPNEYMALGDKLLELIPNPMFGIVPGATSMIARNRLMKNYPQYTYAQTALSGWGNSNYHSLQTRFEKRYSHGLSFLASYTFSKIIADGADGQYEIPSIDIRNQYCRSCDRGLSTYDQPHRFVMNTTYEIPIGRGRALGRSWSRLVDSLLGQWQVNGIMTFGKGLPLRFYVIQNTSNSLGGNQKPDVTGVSPDLGSAKSISRWFDTSQYVIPQRFTFGTEGRTDSRLRMDGLQNLDFSLFKNFRFTERVQMQFRAEAFNSTNTPMFAPPNTTLGNPNFGVVTVQENIPRQIQMGVKILF
jgi:hypothetical protein